MDYALILGCIVFFMMTLMVVVISLYVYVIFAHENEKPFPGISYVIASLILSIFLIFMGLMLLPLDFVSGHQISNEISWGVELDMQWIWTTLLMLSVSVFLLNNFWIRYYRYLDITRENINDMQIRVRIKKGITYVGKYMMFIVPLLFLASFTFGGLINVPFLCQEIKGSELVFSEIDKWNKVNTIHYFEYVVKIIPSLTIIFSTPLIAYGSAIFYIIGSFGLVTVPFNCFNLWNKRPKMPSADQIVMADIILQEASAEAIEKLKEIIELREDMDEMKEDPETEEIELENKAEIFHRGVIESQWNLIQFEEMLSTKKRQHNIVDENPLQYFGALIGGVFALMISILILAHCVLKVFDNPVILETFFFFLKEQSIIHAMLGYLILAFYLLFCIMKGYEKLSILFPEKLGYAILQSNRTWIDTWLVLLNILIPGAWAVIAFFVTTCPNFFTFMYATKIIKIFVINVKYIQIFYRYEIFPALFVFTFFLAIFVNLSTTIKKDELNRRIKETHMSLKNNQQQFQRTKHFG